MHGCLGLLIRAASPALAFASLRRTARLTRSCDASGHPRPVAREVHLAIGRSPCLFRPRTTPGRDRCPQAVPSRGCTTASAVGAPPPSTEPRAPSCRNPLEGGSASPACGPCPAMVVSQHQAMYGSFGAGFLDPRTQTPAIHHALRGRCGAHPTQSSRLFPAARYRHGFGDGQLCIMESVCGRGHGSSSVSGYLSRKGASLDDASGISRPRTQQASDDGSIGGMDGSQCLLAFTFIKWSTRPWRHAGRAVNLFRHFMREWISTTVESIPLAHPIRTPAPLRMTPAVPCFSTANSASNYTIWAFLASNRPPRCTILIRRLLPLSLIVRRPRYQPRPCALPLIRKTSSCYESVPREGIQVLAQIPISSLQLNQQISPRRKCSNSRRARLTCPASPSLVERLVLMDSNPPTPSSS